jgi:MYXO-CTERM domain-containing protein
VGEDGTVAGTQTIGPSSASNPAIAWGGTSWLVTWNRLRRIQATRVAPTGAAMDATPIAVGSGDVGEPYGGGSVAFDGSNWLVAFHGPPVTASDHPASAVPVVGARVATDGSVRDSPPIVLSTAANRQSAASVARSDDAWLLAWEDGRDGLNDVRAARLDDAGNALDPNGIVPARSVNDTGPAFRDRVAPRVAWGRTSWLMVWQEIIGDAASNIYAARIGIDGIIQAPTLVAKTNVDISSGLQVSWGGDSWLVVWARTYQVNIDGARIDESGKLIGSTFSISNGNGTSASVAAGSGSWLVIWQSLYPSCPTPCGYPIYGSRIGFDGTALDAVPLVLSGPTLGKYVGDTGASWGAASWLVWWDSASSTQPHGFARVDPNGDVHAASGFSMLPSDVGPIRAAWGGTSFLLTWSTGQNAGTLSGARFTDDGTALDGPSAFSISETQLPFSWSWESVGDLAADGNGRWMSTYSRYDSSPSVMAVRGYAKIISRGVRGDGCAQTAQCVGGLVCRADVCGDPLADAGTPAGGNAGSPGSSPVDAGSGGSRDHVDAGSGEASGAVTAEGGIPREPTASAVSDDDGSSPRSRDASIVPSRHDRGPSGCRCDLQRASDSSHGALALVGVVSALLKRRRRRSPERNEAS